MIDNGWREEVAARLAQRSADSWLFHWLWDSICYAGIGPDYALRRHLVSGHCRQLTFR